MGRRPVPPRRRRPHPHFGRPRRVSRPRCARPGSRRVTGGIRGDESAFDKRRGAPGWKAYFVGGETPPLSALVVDRALGWPALSPPLLAARALREALVARGVKVDGRSGLGKGTGRRRPPRLGPLGQPVRHRPDDERRQRQLHGRDAPQAPRHARRARGHERTRRAGRRRRDGGGPDPGRRREDRGRLRAVVARPSDRRDARRGDPCGPREPEYSQRVRGLVRRRRAERHAALAAPRARRASSAARRERRTSPARSPGS